MLTSGPRYGTCKGTVLTSNVLDRHSITVISNKNKNRNENVKYGTTATVYKKTTDLCGFTLKINQFLYLQEVLRP